jgi:uncharacterized membrane protein YhhN
MMPHQTAPYAIWTLVATALLVASEWRGSRIGIWVCKPVASLGFVGFAWALGHEAGHAGWLLGAACACALGDVLLIPNDERAFQAGVASFGLGHALYAVAFAQRGVPVAATLGAALGLAAVSLRVYRWLAPGVPAALKPAVGGYCAIITAMVAVAFGTSIATGDLRFGGGAVMFFVSDLAVARDKFVAPGFANRAWGLPLYYAAQLVLVSTLA